MDDAKTARDVLADMVGGWGTPWSKTVMADQIITALYAAGYHITPPPPAVRDDGALVADGHDVLIKARVNEVGATSAQDMVGVVLRWTDRRTRAQRSMQISVPPSLLTSADAGAGAGRDGDALDTSGPDRLDAARYQWLQRHRGTVGGNGLFINAPELDAAIDAAIAAEDKSP